MEGTVRAPFIKGLRQICFYMKWLLNMGKVATYGTCLQLMWIESDIMILDWRFSYLAWTFAQLGIFELYNIQQLL